MDALASIEEGKRRFIKQTQRLVSKGRESNSLHGRVIYKKLIKQYAKAIKAKIEHRGTASYYAHSLHLLKEINPTIIAHYALKVLIDSLSKPCLRNALANKIGRYLQDEINFRSIKDKSPNLWKRFFRASSRRSSYHFKRSVIVKAAHEELGESWKTDWGAGGRIYVGLTLIEILRVTTGIIEYDKSKVGRHYSYSVLPSPQVLEWISNFIDTASGLTPFHLPCVSPPADWTSLKSGGYEYPNSINWCFIKTKNLSSTLKALEGSDLKTVFSAANSLQRVPHRVNQRVLGVLREGLEKGINLGKILLTVPQVTDAGRPCRNNYTSAEKACQAQKHRERIANMPSYIRCYNIFQLANRFLNTNIYFPVQSDFRGRLYYSSSILNPQGCDMAKGLLQFANEFPVNKAEDWFLVGGANNYGIKGTLEKRQQWPLDHQKEIIKVADDPIGYRSFWENCDNPLVFLAWAFEFKEWVNNRITFKTRLPVRLDHTASGLQIISLITNDKRLQQLTNLADNKEPADVYSEILAVLKTNLMKNGRPEYISWLSLGIDRQLVKKITVSYMYGGSEYGMEKIIVAWYINRDNDIFGKDIYKEIKLLIEEYLKALTIISPVCENFMRETRESQKDELLSWTSASGLTVQNLYHPMKSSRIRTMIGNKIVSGNAVEPDTSRLSLQASRNAIAANIIHSHDSALMHIILAENNFEAVQTLHDCYCITPNDCRDFVKILPATLKRIYGVDMPESLLYAAT